MKNKHREPGPLASADGGGRAERARTCSPSSNGVARTYADGCISTVVLWTAILDSGWNPSAGDDDALLTAAAAAAASTTARAAAASLLPMGSSKVARHLCLCFAGRRLVAAEVKGAVACWPSYVQVAIANQPIAAPGAGEGRERKTETARRRNCHAIVEKFQFLNLNLHVF